MPGVIDGLAADDAAADGATVAAPRDGEAPLAPETGGIPVFGKEVPDPTQPHTTAITATPHKKLRAFIVPLWVFKPYCVYPYNFALASCSAWVFAKACVPLPSFFARKYRYPSLVSGVSVAAIDGPLGEQIG